MLIAQMFAVPTPVKVIDKTEARKNKTNREERERTREIDTGIVGDDTKKQSSENGHILDILI